MSTPTPPPPRPHTGDLGRSGRCEESPLARKTWTRAGQGSTQADLQGGGFSSSANYLTQVASAAGVFVMLLSPEPGQHW